MKNRNFLLVLLCSFSSGVLNAQKDSAGVSLKVRASVFYNSYLHYYGRSDSLESSGFFPMVEFWLNDRFYLTGAPIFVTGGGQQAAYAGSVAMAGARFGKENHSAWNFYVMKPIYKESSKLVQSALQFQVAGSGTWLNKIANVTIGGDVKFSGQTDYGLSAGLDHIFRSRLSDRSVLVFDPTVTVNAGTQKFTTTYQKRSGFLFFPDPAQEITEEVTRVSILSYEFSAPVVFATGRLQLIVTPSYVIPKNLLRERGREKFYGIAGVKYSF